MALTVIALRLWHVAARDGKAFDDEYEYFQWTDRWDGSYLQHNRMTGLWTRIWPGREGHGEARWADPPSAEDVAPFDWNSAGCPRVRWATSLREHAESVGRDEADPRGGG